MVLRCEIRKAEPLEQRKRQSNPTVDRSSGYDYRLRAAQAVGVSSASRWMEMSARPGSTAAR